MIVDKDYVISVIRAYLAGEFFCGAGDLGCSNTMFTANTKHESPYIKIMAYGDCVVVCASPSLLCKIKTDMEGKNKDEIFEFPLIYGQTIHYVPDVARISRLELPSEYSYELLQGDELNRLVGINGYENSLVFDDNGCTDTQIVLLAKKDSQIVGLAGAAVEEDRIWEVGVDVACDCRNCGLGTKLVNSLTLEIISQGIVPIYSASITNLASQMVAYRSGYVPCWIDTYGNVLDGSSPYNSIVDKLSIG